MFVLWWCLWAQWTCSTWPITKISNIHFLCTGWQNGLSCLIRSWWYYDTKKDRSHSYMYVLWIHCLLWLLFKQLDLTSHLTFHFFIWIGLSSLFCVDSEWSRIPQVPMASSRVCSVHEFICSCILILVLRPISIVPWSTPCLEETSHTATNCTVPCRLSSCHLRLFISRLLFIWPFLLSEHATFVFQFLLPCLCSTKIWQ